MAFTKIQPQQVQLATFLSHSGHLTFSDLTTGVAVYINKNLTGDFNIDGTLEVNDSLVITSNSTNVFTDSNKALGGSSNSVTGENNVTIGGSNNVNISGDYNVAINTKGFSFGETGSRNTAIGGGTVASFDDAITGSVLIADQVSAASVGANDSLVVAFRSGVDFSSLNSGVEFNSAVAFDGSFFSRSSAEFSSDTNFDGTTRLKGVTEISGDYAKVISGSSISFYSPTDFLTNITVEGTTDLEDDVACLADVEIDGKLTLNGETEITDGSLTIIDSLAATRAFITGGRGTGYDGFIRQTTPTTITNSAAGTLTLQISGWFFQVDGTWYDPTTWT